MNLVFEMLFSPWQIEMLGGLRAVRGDRVIERFTRRSVAALLARLAYPPIRNHPRDELIELLWPEIDPVAGRHNLRQTLLSLRRQLEPPGVPRGGVIDADHSNIGLNPGAIVVDVSEFAVALQASSLKDSDQQRIGALKEAVDLYRGELLPGFYDDWIAPQRQRLADAHQQTVRRLRALMEQTGGFASAIVPLGTLPRPPEESSRAPKPADSADRKPYVQLPVMFTRFFGRDAELERLVTFLDDPETRLITLTGPGGSGKTRLAIQAARRFANLGGAAWFVPLADLTDAGLILGSVAASVGVTHSNDRMLIDAVIERLSSESTTHRCVLVLDNFEQLVEGGADIVRNLLEAVPDLRCLVTSRRILSLEGEQDSPVAPLPVPTAADAPERLMEFPAVELFVDRAQKIVPDFVITPRNAGDVTAICARLEGIPLAIELAAARINVLAPSQILAQLDHRLDFLASRRGDAAERHRTLRSTADWSYQLLSPELQKLFSRLSVFRGGWTLEAVEAICDGSLHELEDLRDRSLVIAEEIAGSIRFRMLETLREYVTSQLDQETQLALQRGHAAYYLSLATRTDADSSRHEIQATQDRVEDDLDNFRAALTWSAEHEISTALSLGAALTRFWPDRNRLSEGRQWSENILGASVGVDDLRRVQIMQSAGTMAYWQGDYAEAREKYANTLVASERIGDRFWLAKAKDGLADIAEKHGDFVESRRQFEDSLSIYRDLDRPAGQAYALHGLAGIAMIEQDYETAENLANESLATYRRLDFEHQISVVLDTLGDIRLRQNDLDGAQIAYEESFAIRQVKGIRLHGTAVSQLHLATIAHRRGLAETANELLGESLANFREVGDKWGMSACLEGLSAALALSDEPETAARLAGAAAALRVRIGNPLAGWELDDHVRTLNT